MTEIVLRGSIKVWDSQKSDKNFFKTYKAGEIFMTAPDVRSYFFGAKKFLIIYEENSITLEYSRSWAPLWFLTSFSSNFFSLDVSSYISLLFSFFECSSMSARKKIEIIYLFSCNFFSKFYNYYQL